MAEYEMECIKNEMSQTDIDDLDMYMTLYQQTYNVYLQDYRDARLIMYQSRKILTNINQFYEFEDSALKAYTKQVHRSLWYYLNTCYQKKQRPSIINASELQMYEMVKENPELITLYILMRQKPLMMIRKVKFLKLLRPLNKKRIKLCPVSQWIPGHLYFEITKTTGSKWKNMGFQASFSSDGYSYCLSTETKSNTMNDEDPEVLENNSKERGPHPHEFDFVYGMDPGIKVPLQMCHQNTKTHFSDLDSLKAYAFNDYQVTQTEWASYIATTEYNAFIEQKTKPIQSINELLSQTTNMLEYIQVTTHNFTSLIKVYGHCDFRQWRFRRYGMRQRRLEYVLQHLESRATKDQDVLWQHHLSDIDMNSLKRAKKKKILIYWGNGSFAHTYKSI